MGERARTIAVGAAAAALSLLLAVRLFGVRLEDLAIPIWYEGDAFYTLALAKGVIDHGSILRNPDLGAPHGLELHDFLNPYGLHFAALHAIARFTDEPGAAVNLLWLLGFPAITACALAALRALGLPRAESAVAALLYAFLPYHLVRGEKHLFLSMYYVVPLAAALAVRLHRDALQLAAAGGRRRVWRPRARARPALAAAAVALAVGASGAYYAYFACFFLAAAGALGALRARQPAPLAAAALLVALVVASVGVGLAPSLLYWREHGTNPKVARRVAMEAELYGLKIAPMLLPIPLHPIPGWAEIRERYDERTPLRGESDTATLGLIGAAGFLLLVGRALARAGGWRGALGLLDSLAALNLAGVLLGTTSGFGAVIARLGLRSIRAYGRLSIFLAFFALAAAVAAIGPLRARLARTPAGAAAGALLLALVLALGLADLVSPAHRGDRAAVRRAFEADRAFVRAAEAALPPGASVFQLPHVEYPEVVGPGRIGNFDSLRPYLHGRSLLWSHGAMKGRPADRAIAALAARPPAALPDALAAAGYRALLVDRAGYAPAQEQALRAALEPRLGAPLVVGADGRLALYALPASDALR